MSSTIITYRPHLGISSDEARNARARAWSYIFRCYEDHKAAGKTGQDEAKSLNIEEGAHHDIEDDVFTRQKV
jgi:hypothetical protein